MQVVSDGASGKTLTPHGRSTGYGCILFYVVAVTYKKRGRSQAKLAREIQQLRESGRMLHLDGASQANAEEAVLEKKGQ